MCAVFSIGCASAPVAPKPVKVIALSPATSMGSEHTVDHRLAAHQEDLSEGELVESWTYYEDSRPARATATPAPSRSAPTGYGSVRMNLLNRPRQAQQTQVQAQTQTQGMAVTGAADVLRLMKQFLDTSRTGATASGTSVSTLMEVLSGRYPQMKSVFERFRTAFDSSTPVDMQKLMQELSGMQNTPVVNP